MKAFSLLLLRLATGLLLMVWAVGRLQNPSVPIPLIEPYYAGVLSVETVQYILGALQLIVGACVVFGLYRVLFYPIQALVFLLGAVVVWRAIADPFGLYLTTEVAGAATFGTLALFAAALVLVFFRHDDSYAFDNWR